MTPETPGQEFTHAMNGIVAKVKQSIEGGPDGDWPETPPLYHYTTPNGLLGIVRTQGILASDAACLNDRSELRYMDHVLTKVGQALEVRTEAGRLLKEQLTAGGVRADFHIGAFIASFSEEPDRLSQWRAYAADGGGYVVGLPPSTRLYVLDKVVEDDPFGPREPWPAPFLKVIYEEREQQALLLPHVQGIATLLESCAEHTTPEDALGAVRLAAGNIGLVAEHLAPRIENPGFGEEKEWRAVVRFHESMYPGHRLRFRPSAHGLTAAVLLQAMDEVEMAKQLPLSEVVLGPKLAPIVAARSAKYLLKRILDVSREAVPPAAEVGAGQPVRVWHSETSYR